MAKFKKRIIKTIEKPTNSALVMGNGFGHLEEILEMFNTVFVFRDDPPGIKSRNLIYKSNLKAVNDLKGIDVVFFDLQKVNFFEHISPLLVGSMPDLIVEGNDVVLKDKTENLYRNGYRALAQGGSWHYWRKVK